MIQFGKVQSSTLCSKNEIMGVPQLYAVKE